MLVTLSLSEQKLLKYMEAVMWSICTSWNLVVVCVIRKPTPSPPAVASSGPAISTTPPATQQPTGKEAWPSLQLGQTQPSVNSGEFPNLLIFTFLKLVPIILLQYTSLFV